MLCACLLGLVHAYIQVWSEGCADEREGLATVPPLSMVYVIGPTHMVGYLHILPSYAKFHHRVVMPIFCVYVKGSLDVSFQNTDTRQPETEICFFLN